MSGGIVARPYAACLLVGSFAVAQQLLTDGQEIARSRSDAIIVLRASLCYPLLDRARTAGARPLSGGRGHRFTLMEAGRAGRTRTYERGHSQRTTRIVIYGGNSDVADTAHTVAW
jgi:hypothetical protein